MAKTYTIAQIKADFRQFFALELSDAHAREIQRDGRSATVMLSPERYLNTNPRAAILRVWAAPEGAESRDGREALVRVELQDSYVSGLEYNEMQEREKMQARLRRTRR